MHHGYDGYHRAGLRGMISRFLLKALFAIGAVLFFAAIFMARLVEGTLKDHERQEREWQKSQRTNERFTTPDSDFQRNSNQAEVKTRLLEMAKQQARAFAPEAESINQQESTGSTVGEHARETTNPASGVPDDDFGYLRPGSWKTLEEIAKQREQAETRLRKMGPEADPSNRKHMQDGPAVGQQTATPDQRRDPSPDRE